jgi:hypothetical protein
MSGKDYLRNKLASTQQVIYVRKPTDASMVTQKKRFVASAQFLLSGGKGSLRPATDGANFVNTIVGSSSKLTGVGAHASVFTAYKGSQAIRNDAPYLAGGYKSPPCLSNNSSSTVSLTTGITAVGGSGPYFIDTVSSISSFFIYPVSGLTITLVGTPTNDGTYPVFSLPSSNRVTTLVALNPATSGIGTAILTFNGSTNNIVTISNFNNASSRTSLLRNCPINRGESERPTVFVDNTIRLSSGVPSLFIQPTSTQTIPLQCLTAAYHGPKNIACFYRPYTDFTRNTNKPWIGTPYADGMLPFNTTSLKLGGPTPSKKFNVLNATPEHHGNPMIGRKFPYAGRNLNPNAYGGYVAAKINRATLFNIKF